MKKINKKIRTYELCIEVSRPNSWLGVVCFVLLVCTATNVYNVLYKIAIVYIRSIMLIKLMQKKIEMSHIYHRAYHTYGIIPNHMPT